MSDLSDNKPGLKRVSGDPTLNHDEDQAAEQQHGAYRDVAAANVQIEALRFGYVSHYRTPFSKQARDEIRTAFPEDKLIYDDADKAERSVTRQYLSLRILTIFTFVGFLVCSHIVIAQYFDSPVQIFGVKLALAGEEPSFALSIGVIFISAFIAVMIRQGLRWAIMREIVRTAERFAHTVSIRFSDIQSQMFEAANNIRDRIGGVKWPQSAEMWAKSALWKAKRAEYLDRYSTTIAWKNRNFMADMEKLAIAIKSILLLAFIALMFLQYSPTEGTVDLSAISGFSTILGVIFILGWTILTRKKNDFWTAAFTKEVSLEESPQSHYYNTIPRIVANIVATIQSNERNSAPS